MDLNIDSGVEPGVRELSELMFYHAGACVVWDKNRWKTTESNRRRNAPDPGCLVKPLPEKRFSSIKKKIKYRIQTEDFL